MPRNDSTRVAILGAGPIGLEAALYARSLKLPVTVYERGQVGAHLRHWGHVRLFSPFGMNRTLLGIATIRRESPEQAFPADNDCITGQEHLKVYLEPLAETGVLIDSLHLGEEVVQIGRRGLFKTESPGDPRRGQHPFLLLVRDSKGQERIDEADVVLDCTGTYGQHRWIGEGGMHAPGEKPLASLISYGLDDVLGEKRSTYAGRNVLVIGGGFSAATTVCNLATLAEKEASTWVYWLARCSNSQPIRRLVSDALPERDRLAMRANMLATRSEGNVEFYNQAVIESLEAMSGGVRVHARIGSKKKNFEVERIIANVGYQPNDALFSELQVHQCYASQGPMALAATLLKQGGDCLTITSPPASALKTTEPNFFILGAKSYGRNSQFLLRAGFDQVRDVFALLVGKPDLDLYKNR
jgi:hypothetical protein